MFQMPAAVTAQSIIAPLRAITDERGRGYKSAKILVNKQIEYFALKQLSFVDFED